MARTRYHESDEYRLRRINIVRKCRGQPLITSLDQVKKRNRTR